MVFPSLSKREQEAIDARERARVKKCEVGADRFQIRARYRFQNDLDFKRDAIGKPHGEPGGVDPKHYAEPTILWTFGTGSDAIKPHLLTAMSLLYEYGFLVQMRCLDLVEDEDAATKEILYADAPLLVVDRVNAFALFSGKPQKGRSTKTGVRALQEEQEAREVPEAHAAARRRRGCKGNVCHLPRRPAGRCRGYVGNALRAPQRL